MVEIINVQGVPHVFLDVMPNWKNGVAVTREYKTDIFTGQSGREQRRALRSTPRKSLSFDAVAAQDRMRRLSVIMENWKGGPLLLPDPTRSARSVALMAPGALSIAVNKEVPWLRAGTLAALEYRGNIVFREIVERQGYLLIFSGFDSESWPVGTKVHPLLQGRLMEGMGQRWFTNSVQVPAIEFSVDPISEDKRISENGPMFDGYEVFDMKPNWATPIQVDFETDVEEVDFERGQRRVYTPLDSNRRLQKNAYLNRDFAAAEKIADFLQRQRGRRGTFLMPTFTQDFLFEDTDTINQGESSLLIRNPELLLRSPHLRIAVLTKDGRVWPNRLLGLTKAASGWGFGWGLDYGGTGLNAAVVLALRDPWPRSFTPSQVSAISWLLPTRLASDSLTITWETDTVSQFQLNTRTLVNIARPVNDKTGWGLNYGRSYGGA